MARETTTTRTRRMPAALAALAVVVALLAGGCGGSDAPTKAEYGKQLRGVMADLQDAYGETGGSAATAPRSVDDLRGTQLALRDAANRLGELTPPESLAAEHDDLVQGVRDMADAVDLLIEAKQAERSDPKRAARLAREFASDDSFRQVQAAAAALQEAGVDAGL